MFLTHLLTYSFLLITTTLWGVDEIRLSYGFPQQEVELKQGGVKTEIEWDDSERWELLLMRLDSQGVWALSVIDENGHYQDNNFDLDYESIGVRLYYGNVFPISSSMSIEFLPYLAYTKDEVRIIDGPIDAKDDEWSLKYGINLNLTIALGRGGGPALSAGAGYIFESSEFDIDGGYELEQQGLILAAAIGYRF